MGTARVQMDFSVKNNEEGSVRTKRFDWPILGRDRERSGAIQGGALSNYKEAEGVGGPDGDSLAISAFHRLIARASISRPGAALISRAAPSGIHQ